MTKNADEKPLLRAYLRPEPRCSLTSQKTALADLGQKIAATYTEDPHRHGEAFPERDSWIADLRKGNLAVVSDFHRLATTGAALKEVRAAIRAKGAIILEARTGRRSDNPEDLGDMIQEALDFYARKGMTTDYAQKLGRLGAVESPVTKRKTGLMPTDEARAIWRDPAMNWEKALAKINADKRYETKYSLKRAYAELGQRQTGAGRKRGPVQPVRGWVYFIQDGKDGPVKIGYSKDPETRARALLCSDHNGQHKLLFVVRGTIATEQKFHKRFTKQHKIREWFHYDGALKRFILQHVKK